MEIAAYVMRDCECPAIVDTQAPFADAVNSAAFSLTKSCMLSGSFPVSAKTSSDIRSLPLLVPFDAGRMTAGPVSTFVNNAHQGGICGGARLRAARRFGDVTEASCCPGFCQSLGEK